MNHPYRQIFIKSKVYAHRKNKAEQGFTIIELILVIVLIGILAVTVAPKMFNSNGFEEHAYQAQIIATLRSIQLRAMQQTHVGNNACHTVVVQSTLLTVGGSCKINEKKSNTVTATNEYSLNDLDVQVDAGHSVTFSTAGMSSNTFTFDSNGTPSNCNSPCEIKIIGSETLTVKIESQGYIHGN